MQSNPNSNHGSRVDLEEYWREESEVEPTRLEKLRTVLFSTGDRDVKRAYFVDLYYHDYGRDKEAISEDIAVLHRSDCFRYAMVLKKALEDPVFANFVEMLSKFGDEDVDGREVVETGNDAIEFWNENMRGLCYAPALVCRDFLGYGNSGLNDGEFGFLEQLNRSLPDVVHFGHDFGNSDFAGLLVDVCNAEDMINICEMDCPDTKAYQSAVKRNLRDLAEIKGRVKSIKFIYEHAKRIVDSFISEVTGESAFQQINFANFIRETLTAPALRFGFEITDFDGDEQAVLASNPEKKVFLRIDPRLNEVPVTMDPNGLVRYFYNLMKNITKEIKGDKGWMICDVRLSDDGKYVLVETTDSGQGFDVDTALKSAWHNLQEDPAYERYLKSQLPSDVVDVIQAWGDNPFAIRRFDMSYGGMIDLYLLEKISGRYAQRASGRRTFGIGMDSMSATMQMHNGTIIVTNTPNSGAKILTVLPVNPNAIGEGEIDEVRTQIEELGVLSLKPISLSHS
jgi:hypothetical protein